MEIQKPENIPLFGRVGPKFVCLDHAEMIGRGDTWIYEPHHDRILLGVDLEAENFVVPDTMALEWQVSAYSPEFGNFKRLRIAGRSVPSGAPQGMHLILTPEMQRQIVRIARTLDGEGL